MMLQDSLHLLRWLRKRLLNLRRIKVNIKKTAEEAVFFVVICYAPQAHIPVPEGLVRRMEYIRTSVFGCKEGEEVGVDAFCGGYGEALIY